MGKVKGLVGTYLFTYYVVNIKLENGNYIATNPPLFTYHIVNIKDFVLLPFYSL